MAKKLGAHFGIPAEAFDMLATGCEAKFYLTRALSRTFSYYAATHSTDFHYQHLAYLDLGGGLRASLAQFDLLRLEALLFGWLKALLFGTDAVFDLRARVAALPSSDAWKEVQLDKIRQVNVALVAQKASGTLLEVLLADDRGDDSAAEKLEPACRQYQGAMQSDNARFEKHAELVSGPGLAGAALVSALLADERDEEGAAEQLVDACEARGAAARSRVYNADVGSREALQRKRDALPVKSHIKGRRGRSAKRTAWDKCAAFLTYSDSSQRQWTCRVCGQTGLNYINKNGGELNYNAQKGMRHVAEKHANLLEQQEREFG